MIPNKTPAELGFRWPAEWEPHIATWLSWPHNHDTWPNALDEAIDQYTAFAKAIAKCEPVHILAHGTAHEVAQRCVGQTQNITIHAVPTNDAWIRDHGPIFLTSKLDDQRLASTRSHALLDWRYNAWGAKYPPFDDDNQVPQRISEIAQVKRFAIDAVLEGGSIEGNGAGVVLTTESCLLNPNRNPNRSRDQIEQLMQANLGCERVIWVDHGIDEIVLPGDDTDGHIDQLVRFVNPQTILVSDPTEDQRLLRNLPSEFEVIELPQPSPQEFGGVPIPTSYANFYIVNGAVLVPAFDDPQDSEAAKILSMCFPDREIISLLANRIVVGQGAFHCLTQQQV